MSQLTPWLEVERETPAGTLIFPRALSGMRESNWELEMPPVGRVEELRAPDRPDPPFGRVARRWSSPGIPPRPGSLKSRL